MENILKQLNYYILLYGLVFVVIFYNYIDTNIGFSYIDEIFVLLLFPFYMLKCIHYKRISKEFITCISIFIFYLLYSLYLSVNITNAIFMDFLIQIKPYISFYVIYSLPLELTHKQKRNIRLLCLFFTVCLLGISLQGSNMMTYFMGHPSRVATAATILAFLYLYCSRESSKDIFITFLIFSVGLLSLRYKFIGFFMISFFTFFFYKIKMNFRISWKVILYGVLISGLIIIVLYDKIYNYVIVGADEDNMWARTALYLFQVDMLNQFIPFGSGFGTYATWASGVYYSPLYSELGIDNLDGMHPDNYEYIADTYFPALAQFGYVGILIFLLFWKSIYKKAKYLLTKTGNIIDFKVVLLIIIFFFIESLADSTITNNRGVFMMIILAMYLSNYKINPKKNENIIN